MDKKIDDKKRFLGAKMERGEFDDDATRIGGDLHAGNHDKGAAVEPAFRALSNGRISQSGQPAPREDALATHWRIAPLPSIDRPTSRTAGRETASRAQAQRPESGGIELEHRRRNNIILLSIVFALGIIMGGGATTAMFAPSLSRSVRSLGAVTWGGGRTNGGVSVEITKPVYVADPANTTANGAAGHAERDGESSERKLTSMEKLAEMEQRLDALKKSLDSLQTAPPVGLPRTADADDAPTLSRQDAKPVDSGESEATSPLQGVSPVSDRAGPSVVEEPTQADRGKLPEEARSLPAPPLSASAREGQRASDEARMTRAFEQFLNERQQAAIAPRDREALFVEFKNSLANRLPEAAGRTSEDKIGRRAEIWQALETTNLRELASAESKVIGEVVKGSTFHVIDRGKDGKWLKIETRDGSTGYYWAARAREMR